MYHKCSTECRVEGDKLVKSGTSGTAATVLCTTVQSVLLYLLKGTLMVVAESFQIEIGTNNFPVTGHLFARVAFSASFLFSSNVLPCFVVTFLYVLSVKVIFLCFIIELIVFKVNRLKLKELT